MAAQGPRLKEKGRAEGQEPEETPGLSDHELEELAPGITQAIRERVAWNVPSNQLYGALYEEIREMARGTIKDMPPEHRNAVMDAAARKIREAQPDGEKDRASD